MPNIIKKFILQTCAITTDMAKKTSTITFRINEEHEKGLRKEAEEKRISLNTLANQILGDHVELDQYMKKFGMIEMSKGAFKELLGTLDEKNIINFAKSIGSKEPKDFILFKWKELTPDTVSDFVKMYFENCGYGVCDMQRNNNINTVSVHHDFGKKGSVFLKAFLEAIIQSTLNRDGNVTITENSVSLKFSN
nr:type II toxin-antitoxin system HicB family antitoxin [Nitrosopumilus piranensis]